MSIVAVDWMGVDVVVVMPGCGMDGGVVVVTCSYCMVVVVLQYVRVVLYIVPRLRTRTRVTRARVRARGDRGVTNQAAEW